MAKSRLANRTNVFMSGHFEVRCNQRRAIHWSRTSAMAMARIIVAPQIASVRWELKPNKLNPVDMI